MLERTFTRPQNALRSFFGLGPAQFTSLDTALPVIEVGNLAQSHQEQNILTNVSAAVAPGAAASVTISLPRNGFWLLDWIGLTTTGPATSGSVVVDLFAVLQRSGISAEMGLLDGERTITKKGAVICHLGVLFRPALVLVQSPSVADVVGAVVFNAAASVGNATVTVLGAFRALEIASSS